MNSLLKLPEGDAKFFSDEKVKDNLRTLLINGALRVINNSILKDYITKEQVIENINKYAKNFEIAFGYDFLESPRYGWDTLLLDLCFFSQTMKNANNINSDLFEYPDLLKMLEIIGLTTVFAYSEEDMSFRLGFSDTKDEYIKGLIANYFATNYDKKEKREIDFGNGKISSYGIYKCLQLNMISVIAHIIGEDGLAEVLISKTPEKLLALKIDDATKQKKMGNMFIELMHVLEKGINSLNFFDSVIRNDMSFYDSNLKPLIEFLEKKDYHEQRLMANYLETYYYDIDNFIANFSIDEELNCRFNEENIEYIKTLEKSYREHEKESMKIGKGGIFFSCLYKDVPKIVPRDGGFYMEDLTFINRLVTEININKSTWEEKLEKVDDATTRMINLLLEKIIPYAIKNKKINLSPAQLEDILSLVTYEKLDLKSSQKSQNEIKKVKRRIDKSKK